MARTKSSNFRAVITPQDQAANDMQHDSSAVVFALQESISKLPSLQRPVVQKAIEAILERDRYIHALQGELRRRDGSVYGSVSWQEHISEVLR